MRKAQGENLNASNFTLPVRYTQADMTQSGQQRSLSRILLASSCHKQALLVIKFHNSVSHCLEANADAAPHWKTLAHAGKREREREKETERERVSEADTVIAKY